ncbi:MAG: hypothetical protein JWQ27_813 [Ferruginibacter sp.]|nr:hypothetical protein [Ferruginibacter sp.]
MLSISQFIGCCLLFACTTGSTENQHSGDNNMAAASPSSAKARHFAGAISNGMKGDSLFFDLSADGSKLDNLTFKGYWRCSGKLESTRVGPEGSFKVLNGKVNDHISEPPNGGSTAWRFDLDATIKGNTAAGTFRMNINNLGCDTYVLKWTAAAR